MTAPTATRPGFASLLTTLTVVAVLLPPPLPADALPVECGSAMVGVGVDYAAGLDNGHPDDHLLDGWNGRPALSDLRQQSFILDRVHGGISITKDGFGALPFDIPGLGIADKAVNVALGITLTALSIAKNAIDVTILQLEHQNGLVDACGGALGGDFIDVFLTALMEEDLALVDLDGSTTAGGDVSAPGTRHAPSAIFMLPQDGHPDWQRDAALYASAPGHSSLGIPYIDGYLNAEYVGIAVLVRNQIAYLQAAGVDTGTTRDEPDPFGGPGTITVYGATDLWEQGVTAMASGDLRLAYARFAQAYRTAVTQDPPPGGSPPAPGTEPPADPTPEPTPTPTATPWPEATPEPTPTPTPTATPTGNPWG